MKKSMQLNSVNNSATLYTTHDTHDTYDTNKYTQTYPRIHTHALYKATAPELPTTNLLIHLNEFKLNILYYTNMRKRNMPMFPFFTYEKLLHYIHAVSKSHLIKVDIVVLISAELHRYFHSECSQ